MVNTMKNITFSADDRLIEAAREQAAADGTTLNEQFRRWLEQYAQAAGRQGAREHRPHARLRPHRGRKFTRDEMNER